MKKTFLTIIVITFSLTFIGCNNKNEIEKPKDNTQIEYTENLENDKVDTNDKNENTSDKNNETTEPIILPSDSNDDTTPSNTPSTSVENEKPEEEEKLDTTVRTFKISSIDVAQNDIIVYNDDLVTVGLGVAENLRLILERVSNEYFAGNEITLETIETIGDTKIAVVNLTGSHEYWTQRFCGSSGGGATEYALVENILQREYPGYWIDGVRFTLNGAPIIDDGHIPGLVTTNYR